MPDCTDVDLLNANNVLPVRLSCVRILRKHTSRKNRLLITRLFNLSFNLMRITKKLHLLLFSFLCKRTDVELREL